jgi:hypothetical protein
MISNRLPVRRGRKGISMNTHVSHKMLPIVILALSSLIQAQPTPSDPSKPEASAGTSTDLFIMFGSDFVRPGLAPRANYNIGLGHTFGFLKKDPIGDEITFAYTYENGGSHGFCTQTMGPTPKLWG